MICDRIGVMESKQDAFVDRPTANGSTRMILYESVNAYVERALEMILMQPTGEIECGTLPLASQQS